MDSVAKVPTGEMKRGAASEASQYQVSELDLCPAPHPCLPLHLSVVVIEEDEGREPDSCANKTPPLSV